MVANTGPAPAKANQTYTSLGLARNHAYTLINAYNVTYKNGSQAALLFQIRNPWGVDDLFNGSWSDTSAFWKDTVNNFAR